MKMSLRLWKQPRKLSPRRLGACNLWLSYPTTNPKDMFTCYKLFGLGDQRHGNISPSVNTIVEFWGYAISVRVLPPRQLRPLPILMMRPSQHLGSKLLKWVSGDVWIGMWKTHTRIHICICICNLNICPYLRNNHVSIHIYIYMLDPVKNP